MSDLEEYDVDNPEHRHKRSSIREAIESAANDEGFSGVVTAWLVIAEICDNDNGEPSRTLYIDDAYHDDYGLVSWTRRGMMCEACREMGL